MIINSPFISGSTTITGNLNVSGSISGTISGSVNNAISASYAVNATSASYAATSSFANDLTVLGTITAQKLNVQQVTSSVVYSSGSNVFGNDISNTQVMTGSVNITGSLIVKGPTTLSDNINSVRINSTTEDSNYIIGSSNTGQSITTGARNIAMGFGSLRDLTSGVENVILGYYAAFNINGSNNIGIGQSALGNIGNGNNNIGIGVATFGNGSAANGSNRIAIGYAAGANSPGAKGIYIGYQAGSSISTGSGNVIIGGNNGSTISGTNNNIILADGEGNIKIQITSGGNVLIATTTDTGLYKLDVNGTGRFSGALTGTSATFSMPSGNGALTIANSSLSGKNWTFLPLTNGAESNLLLFYAGASAGTRLTITNDGNLGLGVTPSAWRTGQKVFQLINSALSNFEGNNTILSYNYYRDTSNNIYINTGFASSYVQISGQHQWYTAPSGTAGNAISFTQAMTLDASGRLGIGTTSPISTGGASRLFQIEGTTNFPGISVVRHTADSGAPNIVIGKSRATANGGVTIVQNGDDTGFLSFVGANGVNLNSYTAAIISQVDGTPSSTSMPGRLILSTTASGATNPTERIRITSAGNVGIGTTSPDNPLTVKAGVNTAFVVKNAALTHNLLRVSPAGSVAPNVDEGVLQVLNAGVVKIQLYSAGTSYFDGGNVLIGTTTDTGLFKLDVNGTGRFSGTAGNGSSFFNFNTTSANSVFNWVSTAFASNLAVDNNLIHFIGQSGSTKNSAYLGFKYKGSGSNNNILTLGLFAVDNVLNINGLGNVGIGTESPTTKLEVIANANTFQMARLENTNNTSGNGVLVTNLGSNCNNTSSYHLIAGTGGADRMYIYGNGNVVNVNNSYGTLSDIRLKENIIDATPKLNDLLNLKVRNFNLIGDENKQIGFIADEFEEIFPKMVEIDGKSGMKSIKTSVLVPMLVKAIQEQQAQINELKALIK